MAASRFDMERFGMIKSAKEPTSRFDDYRRYNHYEVCSVVKDVEMTIYRILTQSSAEVYAEVRDRHQALSYWNAPIPDCDRTNILCIPRQNNKLCLAVGVLSIL